MPKMKLSKAIEILAYEKKSITHQGDKDYSEALQLGIEAMKRVKNDRIVNEDLNPYPLPGEDLV